MKPPAPNTAAQSDTFKTVWDPSGYAEIRKVLQEVLKKNDYRLQIANTRRAQSMMQRFG